MNNKLDNKPSPSFNEWCKEFNVSSKYNKKEELHTRRKLSHIIQCDTITSGRIDKEAVPSTSYILPHTQISFINGYK